MSFSVGLRKTARKWLRTAIDHFAQADELAEQTETLEFWLTVNDFASVRDESQLAKLSKEEREAWQQLWHDARALHELPN